MSKYRLLALDLDGTTLLDNKKISEATKLWIKRAMQKGIIVTFATGRGHQNIENFRLELGLTTPLVLLNGAEIWQSPGLLMERHIMDRKSIELLHQIAYETNSWFWGYNIESLIRKSDWTEEMFEKKWIKFGIRNDSIAVISDIKGIIEKWEKIEVTQSSPSNVEITFEGMTKAYGVRQICDFLGIDMDQVIAIGDSYNDLKLIEAVGLGVAMGNAEVELKGRANCMTDTNEQDGVAKAICRYIFEEEYRER
ncbi:Cof-type HAD-IIB family hydrolase [Bacillus sp. FSL K6-3431]|uniref:Cof-type HAD-IIB family hydrolase n=1 Tax=Bacillus sp. FSL K6-3431 TaxID=2921500 RepID=UPI0030F74F47